MTDANGRKRGSIALARELCVQIAGYTDDDQDQCGHDYGSVDVAEILSAEVVRLQKALAQPQQQAEPPPEWEGINNIIAEYGLQAIDFVADWKATLGQAEPVAWGVFDSNLHDMFFTEEEAQEMVRLKGDGSTVAPLYTTTTQPEQQAEPVAWMSSDRAWMWSDYSKALAAVAYIPRLTLIPLYTTPPQRPWVGLTEEDWEQIHNRKGTALDTFAQGAVWAETQLRERNK